MITTLFRNKHFRKKTGEIIQITPKVKSRDFGIIFKDSDEHRRSSVVRDIQIFCKCIELGGIYDPLGEIKISLLEESSEIATIFA